jgi:hypothetical protein
MKIFVLKILALLLSLVVIFGTIFLGVGAITLTVTNEYTMLLLTALISGLTVPLMVYILTKTGISDVLVFDLFEKTFYIRPWKFFLPIYREIYPRKVLLTSEMTDEMIEQIKNIEMDSRHDHLNNLYDDIH